MTSEEVVEKGREKRGSSKLEMKKKEREREKEEVDNDSKTLE